MIFQLVLTMSLLNSVMENVIHIIHIRKHMISENQHSLLRRRNNFVCR
jgi:ABC-type histidine transport system ATPase subunit